jgi:hypothetical protein
MRLVEYARDMKCIQSLVRNSERKGVLGTPRHRSEDNIKMNCKEIGLRSRSWQSKGGHSPTSVVSTLTVLKKWIYT